MMNYGNYGEVRVRIFVITIKINILGKIQSKSVMTVSCEMRLNSEVKDLDLL